MATLGVDSVFAYGVVSNINAAALVTFSWFTFSKAAGVSPLAPGQWPKFFATYTGIYLTVGNLLRPLRFAAAASLTPVYGGLVSWLQARLPLKDKPKLNRTLAILVLSLLVNTTGTCALIAAGAWLAGLVTGVPALPVGWRWPGARV